MICALEGSMRNMKLLFMLTSHITVISLLLTGCMREIKTIDEVNTLRFKDFVSSPSYVCIQTPYIEKEQFEKLTDIKIGIAEFSSQIDGTVLWVSEDKKSFKRFKLKNFYYDQSLHADKAGREAEYLCRKIDETACIKLDKNNHVFSIGDC